MTRSISSRWILVGLALTLALPVQQVRADPMLWDFSTFVFPNVIKADTFQGGPGSPIPPGTPKPGVTFQGASGTFGDSASISLANWLADTVSLSGAVATFNHRHFQIGMGILDQPSNQSSLLTFDAYLDGTITTAGPNLTISYTQASKSVVLGGATYDITLGDMILDSPPNVAFVQSIAPSQVNGGIIAANVDVRRLPEPSALLLLALGGSLTSAMAYRRRRLASAES